MTPAVHAILGWAVTATLVGGAAARIGGAPERGSRAAAFWGGALAALAFVTGLARLFAYEGRTKQLLFLRSFDLGLALERKLHLSVGATALALAACALAWASRACTEKNAAASLERASTWALALAAALAVLVTTLGTMAGRGLRALGAG